MNKKNECEYCDASIDKRIEEYLRALESMSAGAETLKSERPRIRGPKNTHPPYGLVAIRNVFKDWLKRIPFRVGDRVELVEQYVPEEDSGWWHHRETFKKGAKATVEEIALYGDLLIYSIKFDEEYHTPSYPYGKVHQPELVSDRHNFMFGERHLKKEEIETEESASEKCGVDLRGGTYSVPNSCL